MAHAVTLRRDLWAPRALDWWIGWLFMLGSACFAIASLPVLAVWTAPRVVGVTYFVGSILFTAAAATQLAQAIRARPSPAPGAHGPLRGLVGSAQIDRLASGVQLVGTLFFNWTTAAALNDALTTSEELRRVWAPDAVGSVCFLIASQLALMSVCRRWWCRRRTTLWRIAALNLLGSVFFGISAVTSYILPSTGEVLDAAATDLFTLLGALCFLAGAWMLLPRRGS
jgi:hypothetical protein